MTETTKEYEREMHNDTALVSLVSKAELDQAITTAHSYPRSITKFRRDALEMATMDEQTAQECIYALPRRDGNETKMITGPSARLAEIIVSAWGNVRAGARIIDEGREFVTAQGVFHDLERNTGITYEVKRRITNREGHRFSADMIGVTANAACSIALRNAVFKGVPKALWAGVETEVRRVIAGDAKTLGSRREKVVGNLNKMGVSNEQIFTVLNVAGIADIGLEEIVTLNGLGNAIKEGEMSIEEAFSLKPESIQGATRAEQAKNAMRATETKTTSPPVEKPEVKPSEVKPVVKDEWLDAAAQDTAKQVTRTTTKPAERPEDQLEKPNIDQLQKTSIDRLTSAKTMKELRAKWDKVIDDYTFNDLEIPQSIEAKFLEMKETLA